MDPENYKKQDYHEAIKNVVEHLKTKRNELQCEISSDEKERAKVIGEMDKLKDKLSVLDANLRKKSEFRKEYDKAILQSEGHFVELMQKSEDFLSRARREALALCHVVGDPSSVTSCTESLQKKPSYPNSVSSAVAKVQPADQNGTCVGCSNTYNCTTIAVPYRANGL